jgi:hypothetical protein
MTDLRTAAQQALEALKGYRREMACGQPCDAERVLEATLAQQEQPDTDCHAQGVCQRSGYSIGGAKQDVPEAGCGNMVWMVYTQDGKSVCVTDNPADFTDMRRALPLYTAPPAREPLTEDEIERLIQTYSGYCRDDFVSVARAIERAHGIKGGSDE